MSNDCGCCTGIEPVTPERLYNRPGLNALSYRVGTYATFFETMQARLHTMAVEVESPSGGVSVVYPLQTLTTRQPDDPAIALLDAWAMVADVLTFYEERIANEGYLSTATERVSMVELARLIGYRLRPGVASSVFLALSVADGFEGVLPAGTRAQSVPGAGETAQFFETDQDLPARSQWNALKPRLTRPQIITPLPVAGYVNNLGTNADVVDALFLQGVATSVKPGDALLISLGEAAEQKLLRTVESAEIEGGQGRTRLVLEASLGANVAVADELTRFVDDATAGFDGSDLATQAAQTLRDLLKPNTSGSLSATTAAAAMPKVRMLQAVAVKRGFVRLEPWLGHMADVLGRIATSTFNDQQTSASETQEVPTFPNYAVSSLSQLDSLLKPLSKPVSVQPRNALALLRTPQSTFQAQSDTVPRLLQALRPIRAREVYAGWANAEPNPLQLKVYAMRAKAALFASSFAGAATFVRTGKSLSGVTRFASPTLGNAWGQLLAGKLGPAGGTPATLSLSALPLDTVNDKIQSGSWIAVERPLVENGIVDPKVAISFHRVSKVRTVAMEARGIAADSSAGYAAKVTVLEVSPPWLDAPNQNATQLVLASIDLLRSTAVYVQAEPVELAEEPLDRDVKGSSLELDGLYDGLEPGRWAVVTGMRTDLPNVAGVRGSELVMISGVTQGKGKTSCRPFLLPQVPLQSVTYISKPNGNGDRVVVGIPARGLQTWLGSIGDPDFDNQEFCEQVQLAPGFYADAYVPSAAERAGIFADFANLLIDPDADKGNILSDGKLPDIARYFGWRIRNVASGAETVHTTLDFANALAYTYDSTTVSLMANVAKATHGQTTGEVLGDGDASQPFQSFALSHSPLTYTSANEPDGAASTLTVTVNDVEWNEADDLSPLRPKDHAFITAAAMNGKLRVVFGDGAHGARLPTGSANVKAAYRYGLGKAGNVNAGAISQMATHPMGAKDVTNPLPASGGADPDTLDQARRNAPAAVLALDRLVSVQDYADFARTFAGVGKACSTRLADGRRQLVLVTIAGAEDIPIATSSDLYRNLLSAFSEYGDPFQPVQLCVRRVALLVISTAVQLLPGYSWDAVAPEIRRVLLATFSFDTRELGQAAYQSEAVAATGNVEGVSYLDVKIFDSVAEDTTVKELATLAAQLRARTAIPADGGSLNTATNDVPDTARFKAAELIFLSPDLPETLILTQLGSASGGQPGG